MKDKFLRSEVIKAAENLCRALRNYSEGQMFLSLKVYSRDETEILDDPQYDKLKKSCGVPDCYSVKICVNEDECLTQLIGDAKLVFYSFDEHGEMSIRQTYSIYSDGEDEDE